MSYVEIVKESIEAARKEQSQLTEHEFKIDGMSSRKVRHLLNNINNKVPDCKYFEIGTWKGSTFFSASFKNKGLFVGMDNFKFFDGPADIFYKNYEYYANIASQDLDNMPTILFYEADCWEFDPEKLPKINVYFYDGRHLEEMQTEAFIRFNDRFENEFIAIVDDWNREQVKTGTKTAFDMLGYDILYEEALEADTDGTYGDVNKFWNGVYVAVLRKHG